MQGLLIGRYVSPPPGEWNDYIGRPFQLFYVQIIVSLKSRLEVTKVIGIQPSQTISCRSRHHSPKQVSECRRTLPDRYGHDIVKERQVGYERFR